MANFPRGVEVIVSALIVSPNDEILLVKQPQWGEVWTLPGGHLEPGESLLAGARREGQEETGLHLTGGSLINWGELIEPDRQARPVHFIFFDYAFRTVDCTLRIDPSEISVASWIPFDEVLLKPLTKGYRETIQKYLCIHDQSVRDGAVAGASNFT